MSGTEGALPGSGTHDLRDAGETMRLGFRTEPGAPRLPTAADRRPGDQLLPPAKSGTPILGGSGAKSIEALPNAPQKALELPLTQAPTLAIPVPPALGERLAAATLSGGLTELPANFGDTGGDWVTVQSDNPFEVLYFDYRRADRITPETVGRHREFLHRFWQEKLKSMSQGAARLAIVKKYGGQYESERLVHSFPDLIDRAYHRLSTASGIEEAYREIVTRQQKVVFARIDEKLTDFLVDSVLQPQETVSLFEFADREGVAREVVAAHVQDRIRSAGLVSDGAVNGATLEQQLLSSAWVHPSRKVPAQALARPQPRSGMLSLLLFSLAVLVLIVGLALYRMKSASRTESGGAVPPVSARQITQELRGASAPAPPAATPAVPEDPPHTMPRRIEEPPAQPAVSVEVEETRAQPAVSVEDRKAVQDELEGIRTLSSTDPSGALERALQLDSTLAAQPQEFAGERVELANLRGQIQTAVMEVKLAEESRRHQEESDARAQRERTKEWEQRLAQIESLSKQGNFSGAKTLADQLLSEQDVPEPIAIRARKMSDEAVAKLQAIFSGAKVKSKTVRSTDPPQ